MKPRQELHLFLASENTKALILFRASNRLYRLVGWDTDGDRFIPGQWLKSRVFEADCALSPDGEHFLYTGMLRGTSDHFMAISHPPYFTAVEFYPGLSSYTTGGFFLDSHTVSFKSFRPNAKDKFRSCGLRIGSDPSHWRHHRTRSEWKRTPRAETDGLIRSLKERRGQSPALSDCYHCEDARLYRKTIHGKTELADFSDMVFEPIIAPYKGIDWNARNEL